MLKIKFKKSLNLILIFSIFAIIFAFFIEYILGHKPCNLCLVERIPYYLVIIIILFSLFLEKFLKISLIFISIIFFLATLVSFYHFGIEQGFIEESLVCDLNIENSALTKEALLNELKEKSISCKDVTLQFLDYHLRLLIFLYL